MEAENNARADLVSRLARAKNLPSPPGVALRVIELGQDPNVNMGRVVDAVSADPALTAKILRIANSAYYGRRRKTQNLRQAIVLLGLNGTLSLALSFSLVDALRGSSISGLDYDLFWRRSLGAATCARALGAHLRLGRREELFLASLLQDIGMLALDKIMPTLYRAIEPVQAVHGEVRRVEREAVGTDHAMVGAWLLSSWNLPESFQVAVESSHDLRAVESAPEERVFAKCVFASGPVADIWFRDDWEQATEEAAHIVQEHLGISREALVPLLDATAAELRDNAGIFDVEQDDPEFAESILEHAKEILLVRTLQTMREADELQRATASLESRTRELEEVSRRDSLTRLFNRAHFDAKLAEEFREAAGRQWPLTVMLIDLDHFKAVNDTYGHQSGDEVLIGAARVLEEGFRDSDTCARYGGEEFAAILPGTGLSGARAVCERLLQAFRSTQHPMRSGEHVIVTASIGVASLGEPGGFAGMDTLMAAADEALYAAKRAGRNQFVLYGAEAGTPPARQTPSLSPGEPRPGPAPDGG